MATKLLGNVDLLGLNQFGENPGMNPIWGVAIGGGTAAITSLALQRSANPTGTAAQNADLIGFLVGLASGGALFSMKSTRHAAWGAFAGAFFASGLKWLEGALFGTPTPAAVAASVAAVTGTTPAALPAAAGVSGRLGLPMITPLNGGRLGLPMITPLNGGGLGLPSISNYPTTQGAIPGVAGPQLGRSGSTQPPVSLLGHQLAAGGPQISGLSARYGASLYGRQ